MKIIFLKATLLRTNQIECVYVHRPRLVCLSFIQKNLKFGILEFSFCLYKDRVTIPRDKVALLILSEYLDHIIPHSPKKNHRLPCENITTCSAVTRIRTWVVSATTRSTNHYTITASEAVERLLVPHKCIIF